MLHTQFPGAHAIMLHDPGPLQLIVHPPPLHDRLVEPAPFASTVQPPWSQVRLHEPFPWHWNAHPAPLHVRSQLPLWLHTHAWPRLHVPLVGDDPSATVVLEHATIETGTAANASAAPSKA